MTLTRETIRDIVRSLNCGDAYDAYERANQATDEIWDLVEPTVREAKADYLAQAMARDDNRNGFPYYAPESPAVAQDVMAAGLIAIAQSLRDINLTLAEIRHLIGVSHG